jgi:hypothetical protein
MANNPHKITTVQTEAMGDGLGVYNEKRDAFYVLNPTAAVVWRHCDGRHSPANLAALIQQNFNIPRAEADKLVGLTLSELNEAGLLREAATSIQSLYSRRQVLKAFTAVGLSAALLPVISLVREPATVLAQTGAPVGGLTSFIDTPGETTTQAATRPTGRTRSVAGALGLIGVTAAAVSGGLLYWLRKKG